MLQARDDPSKTTFTMKSVRETLLQRTSVRRYQRRAIEPEKIEFIYRAIQNTQTSYNGQQYSVIAITNQPLKEEIEAITGQKQIKTCALFLVFCVDYHKQQVICEAKGLRPSRFQDTIDGYTVGVVDAALAMQNAVVAAEAIGLGSCCIGYTRTADPGKISQLLALPEGVAIVCGLAIGYPAETPDLKPKQPLPLLIHQNRYHTEQMKTLLLEYDQEVSHYNRTRCGETTCNDWGGHILDYHRHGEQYELLKYLARQGLHIGR